MRVAEFDYELPQELIALRPAEPRDSARLLVIDGMNRSDKIFSDLPGILKPGDLLVLNDTKVLRARLHATRPARIDGGAAVAIEVLLHHRTGTASWEAFARPAKRLRANDLL